MTISEEAHILPSQVLPNLIFLFFPLITTPEKKNRSPTHAEKDNPRKPQTLQSLVFGRPKTKSPPLYAPLKLKA